MVTGVSPRMSCFPNNAEVMVVLGAWIFRLWYVAFSEAWRFSLGSLVSSLPSLVNDFTQ